MLVFLSWLSDDAEATDYILQDFGGEDASCLPQEDFGKLRPSEEEASLKVGLKCWCIVKLE